MPKPPTDPPDVAHVIRVGTPMQMWCDFCRRQYAVRRGDLEAWVATDPALRERLAMEVPRLMRCRYCGNQTLNGLLSGSIDHMAGSAREQADKD